MSSKQYSINFLMLDNSGNLPANTLILEMDMREIGGHQEEELKEGVIHILQGQEHLCL